MVVTKFHNKKFHKIPADSNINSLLIKKSKNQILMGYGACHRCKCPGYEDSYGSELCNNCGHKYTDHW